MEAVVLGSLPGFAGPWLTQYAHHLAQAVGPVLLVHLDAQAISLEIVQPAAPRMDAAEDAAPGHSAQHREPFTSPVQAIDQLAQTEGSIRHVLLHVDEPARLLELACPKLTILCGAYDAAVLDAVQRLQAIHDLASQGAGLRMHVGMMVMGSDAPRAREAAQKLAAAVDFLPTPVQLVGSRKQMLPVQVQRLADFPATEEHWSDLKAYFEELANYEPPAFADIIPPETSEPPEAPEAVSVASEIQSPKSDIAADIPIKMAVVPTRRTPSGSAPGTTPRTGPSEQGQVPEEIANLKSQIENTPAPAPADPLAIVAARLPGSIALDARAPQQKEVRLLLDQDGRVHLLHLAADADDLAPAVVDLIQARLWVRAHLELLALTQRQCKFAPDTEPALHLATTNAQLAPALARKLEAYLQVHLLQHVPPSTQPTWLCVEV